MSQAQVIWAFANIQGHLQIATESQERAAVPGAAANVHPYVATGMRWGWALRWYSVLS